MWDSFITWDLVISIVQGEKGQQGIWSINSVCDVHNAQAEEWEIGWPEQYWGFWPWCFLVLLGGRHLQQKDVKTAQFLNCIRINWHLTVTVHWKSQISDVIPPFWEGSPESSFHPSSETTLSPQNSVNLLDLIIFLKCSTELYRIALKTHSKI